MRMCQSRVADLQIVRDSCTLSAPRLIKPRPTLSQRHVVAKAQQHEGIKPEVTRRQAGASALASLVALNQVQSLVQPRKASAATAREVVEQVYDEIEEGDLVGFEALNARDAVYSSPSNFFLPSKNLSPSEFFSTLSKNYKIVNIEVKKIIADEATGEVVAQIDIEGEVKATGKSYKTQLAHFFTVKDGLVVAFNEVLDMAPVIKASALIWSAVPWHEYSEHS